MNRKGMTLLEMLVVLILVGIIVKVLASLGVHAAKITMKLNKAISTAQLDKPNPAKIVRVQATCNKVHEGYYAKTSDNTTVYIYTNEACSQASFLGTLNYLDNASWFNEAAMTSWLVYRNAGILKVFLVKYDLITN